MRVEMGVLQLETTGRPDGQRPGGAETHHDYLIARVIADDDEFVMSEEECAEADREFVQFYHRRICWLAMRKYRSAVKDADHTLELMDFCRQHSPDERWTLSHEQYRPFVLFHRTQAAALAQLEASGPEAAIQEVNQGLDRLRDVFSDHDADEEYDADELVSRLVELRESLRDEYDVGRTLQERLADAIATEQYEVAAKLRDELKSRRSRQT
jgi:hypothetical protein